MSLTTKDALLEAIAEQAETLATNLPSALTTNSTTVTVTKNSSAVGNIGSYQAIRKGGGLVVANFNFNLLANQATQTVLFTGLPKPMESVEGLISNGSTVVRVYVNTDGELKLDGAGPSSAGYVAGQIVYFTEE